jgi:hypothetical protein
MKIENVTLTKTSVKTNREYVINSEINGKKLAIYAQTSQFEKDKESLIGKPIVFCKELVTIEEHGEIKNELIDYFKSK